MANALYPKFKQSLLNGEINLATDNIVAYAVDTTSNYTYSDSHETISDLPTTIAVTPNLASKTIVNGVFNSADPVLPSVTGVEFEAIVLYDSTSDNLVAYYDSQTALTPSGNNVTINVNASGWFSL